MARKRKQDTQPNAGAAANATPVPLLGKLEEFRTALREEIEAARKTAANSAVPLVHGRTIGRAAGGFQYAFQVANVVNLPADVPGDLVVDGQLPRPVTVISVDGLTVVLHVAENLGEHVPAARLQTDLTFLMRRLIERVEGLADRTNPVGDRIVDGLPISGSEVPIEIETLNEQQLQAVASSVGRDTTFIWGPPGTGKTRTIGAIAEQLYRRRRSVLLVSHTNTAVDQALLHLGRSLPREELETGTVLRLGAPRDQRLQNWSDLLLSSHVERRSEQLVQRQSELEGERMRSTEEQARMLHLIKVHEWLPAAEKEGAELRRQNERMRKLEDDLVKLCVDQQLMSAESREMGNASSMARDAMARENSLKRCSELLEELGQKYSAAETALQAARSRLVDAERQHRYASSLAWVSRKWHGVEEPSKLFLVVEQCGETVTRSINALDDIKRQLAVSRDEEQGLRKPLDEFLRQFGAGPRAVLAQAEQHSIKLRTLDAAIENTRKERAKHRGRMVDAVRRILEQARSLALSEAHPSTLDEQLSELQHVCQRAKVLTTGTNPNTLRSTLELLKSRLSAIAEELASIANKLSSVESSLISDASVIATTLTRSYLKDALHARRFDTVILDEASMAPLPALWVAASLADQNAVVVGDFKQLPPIVQSKHEMAVKWLGRDVFEVARVNDTARKIAHRIDLLVQYRMHPDVSRIPNILFYGGALRDAPETFDENADLSLTGWHDKEWSRDKDAGTDYDRPLLLVDMEPMKAWVTSVGRTGQPSRLNFLSATVCVDIAEKLLRADRKPLEPGQAPRILIICPYRPHARLLELLIREQGLSGDVVAGTAHSFQGTEASVVIVDLVNDEPHWRVRMFDSSADDGNQRLLNVALTRAQRRLVVVGNFSYIEKKGKKAFLGRMLLPLLRRWSPPVSAKDIVREEVEKRAAKIQSIVAGGRLEARDERIIVTQDDFDRLLMTDLQKAKSRVVIFSPFLTSNRLEQIGLHLQAIVASGVRLYVITKALNDRGEREKAAYRNLERMLRERGVVVIHMQRMHQKLIFIDDDILWSGSLNPLSFRDTQEVMERRRSSIVASDYATAIKLDELIAPYERDCQSCPYCRSEVIAAEGRGGVYWKCSASECSYARSVDQEAPTIDNGVLKCRRCGADLQFEEYQGKPCWRCKGNTRHRQRVEGMHLHLPRMAAIVPDEWRQSFAPSGTARGNGSQMVLWPNSNGSTASGADRSSPPEPPTAGNETSSRTAGAVTGAEVETVQTTGHRHSTASPAPASESAPTEANQPPIKDTKRACSSKSASSAEAPLPPDSDAARSSEVAATAEEQAILSALRKERQPMGVTLLSVKPGVDRRTLECTLAVLVKSGDVVETGSGRVRRYSLPGDR